MWARSDNTRGVHKAPANEVVRGATGLAYNVTKGEQDTLNPFGVNCIRAFPGMGIRIWGARTLSSNPSWRYINVRRCSTSSRSRSSAARSGWCSSPTSRGCGAGCGAMSAPS